MFFFSFSSHFFTIIMHGMVLFTPHTHKYADICTQLRWLLSSVWPEEEKNKLGISSSKLWTMRAMRTIQYTLIASRSTYNFHFTSKCQCITLYIAWISLCRLQYIWGSLKYEVNSTKVAHSHIAARTVPCEINELFTWQNNNSVPRTCINLLRLALILTSTSFGRPMLFFIFIFVALHSLFNTAVLAFAWLILAPNRYKRVLTFCCRLTFRRAVYWAVWVARVSLKFRVIKTQLCVCVCVCVSTKSKYLSGFHAIDCERQDSNA